MAVATDSTVAPSRTLLPRMDFSPAAIMARAEAFASTIATRVKARPPVEDHRSPAELLEEIRRTIEREGVVSTEETHQGEFHDQVVKLELPPEPLLAADVRHGGAGLACQADTPLLPLPAPLPSLPAALSRRRAIFGAVAFAAAPVAVQAAPSPKSGETPAGALDAEFDRLSASFTAARDARDEADARYVAPETPERLYVQDGDSWLLLGAWPRGSRPNTRTWWGYPGEIERLKELRLVYVGGEPDLKARARRDEIVALADAYWQADQRAEDDAGVTQAREAWSDAAAAYFDFIERLVALRTVDPAIMRLKARVVAADLARHDGLDAYLSNAIEGSPGEVETLGLSLVRDMVAGLGLAA